MISSPGELAALEGELARLADLLAAPSTPADSRAQLQARFALLQQQAIALRQQQAAG